MPTILHPKYAPQQTALENLAVHFEQSGTLIVKGARNSIKTNELNNETVSIKFFKTPGFFKSIIYSWFRQSKAKRSFNYALYLQQHGILTPFPIGYIEERKALGLLGDSFYFCQHIDYDFTIRELIHDPLFPNRKVIIEQFTEFTFKMHEANINFLDHSPGNTLIKEVGDGSYDFYLIDLNRMRFEPMNILQRMDNFKKMWLSKTMLQTVAATYARLSGISESELWPILWQTSQDFKRKINKKKWLKRKLRK